MEARENALGGKEGSVLLEGWTEQLESMGYGGHVAGGSQGVAGSRLGGDGEQG